MTCITSSILPIAEGRDNRIPFRVRSPAPDLGPISVADKIVTGRFRPSDGTQVDLGPAGVDMSNALLGEVAFDLTAAQISDWPVGATVELHIWLFNSDNSVFANGMVQALVKT